MQPQVKMGRAPQAPVKLGKAQATSTLSKQLMQVWATVHVVCLASCT